MILTTIYHSTNTGAIAGGVVGGFAFLVGIVAVFCSLRRMQLKRENILEARPAPLEPSFVGETSASSSRQTHPPHLNNISASNAASGRAAVQPWLDR